MAYNVPWRGRGPLGITLGLAIACRCSTRQGPRVAMELGAAMARAIIGPMARAVRLAVAAHDSTMARAMATPPRQATRQASRRYPPQAPRKNCPRQVPRRPPREASCQYPRLTPRQYTPDHRSTLKFASCVIHRARVSSCRILAGESPGRYQGAWESTVNGTGQQYAAYQSTINGRRTPYHLRPLFPKRTVSKRGCNIQREPVVTLGRLYRAATEPSTYRNYLE